MTQPTAPAPFNVDDAARTVTTAVIGLITLSFREKDQPVDPEAGKEFAASVREALLAGSAACAEITRMRTALTSLRDNHRPRPHADPNQPGALCTACSLHGALIAWPCETWTAVDQVLTHGQA